MDERLEFFHRLAGFRKDQIASFAHTNVDCLHLDAEVLQPMAKSGYQNRIELRQGTLDMLILKTLQWGEQHGYGISQAIRASSGEVLQVETGSLYPALHRLERAKWVSAEWRRSDSKSTGKVLPDYGSGEEAIGRRL